jgi:hypothetical protein
MNVAWPRKVIFRLSGAAGKVSSGKPVSEKRPPAAMRKTRPVNAFAMVSLLP